VFRDFLIQKDSCPLSQMMDLTKRMMRRQLKEKKEGEVLRRLWSLNCISRGEEFFGLVVNLKIWDGSAQPSLFRVWIITS